jgi:hypothetical protein
MNEEIPRSLETRLATPRQVELVSNMNGLRTGQLMDSIEKANRRLNFLKPGKQVVLVERNHDYLDEILAKILPELCPNHIVSYQDHHMPHYVVHDGRVEMYHNLDKHSPVAKVKARLKHPDSLAEKVPRKAQEYGRTSERNDKHKLMVGDVGGAEVVVRNRDYVPIVTRQILGLPFLKLEKFEQHRKSNGYMSDHLNLIYENGNPEMRGLEIEIQVTDLESHRKSRKDPKQGHKTVYGAEKLSSNHHLDGQLVIVGNSVEVPQECNPQRVDGWLVAHVPNKIQPYKILVPRLN